MNVFITKSRIRETNHLSTNADSRTDTKKILLVWQNLPEFFFFLRSNFTVFISKSFQIRDHFFPLLFPKDSENLKSLDIGLQEMGAKRRLKGVKNIFLNLKKKTFLLRRFYTFYEQKLSNPRPFFLKDSENLKRLDIGLREVGAKRP